MRESLSVMSSTEGYPFALLSVRASILTAFRQ